MQFPTYEVVKTLLNPTNSYSPTTHIIAGGTAGAIAAALTTPIDVIKTVLQTRGLLADEERNMIKGMKSAIKWIYRRQGWRGFAKGALTQGTCLHAQHGHLLDYVRVL